MSRSVYRIGSIGDRPLSEPQLGATPILAALRYGITAPSAHNTQPWRIEVVSETEARVYFDPSRRLSATDPPGRQVHISHGTLIELTAIAATSLGFRTEVELLPGGEVTLSEFGTKPTAILRLLREPGLAVDPLFGQILSRRSSRLGHVGPPVSNEERTRIATEAAFPGVEIGWIPDDQLATVLDIAAQAMTIEVDDHQLFEETNHWFRFTDREIDEK